MKSIGGGCYLYEYPSGHCIICNDKIDNSMIQFAGRLIKNIVKKLK